MFPSCMFRRITRGGRGEVSPAFSQKLGKSALILEKMPWLWPSWVKFFKNHLKYSFKSFQEKKTQFFFLRGLSFMCCWRNVYRSDLITIKLPCPEKFLVTRLMFCIIDWHGNQNYFVIIDRVIINFYPERLYTLSSLLIEQFGYWTYKAFLELTTSRTSHRRCSL